MKGSLEVEKKGGEISPTEKYIDFYTNQVIGMVYLNACKSHSSLVYYFIFIIYLCDMKDTITEVILITLRPRGK